MKERDRDIQIRRDREVDIDREVEKEIGVEVEGENKNNMNIQLFKYIKIFYFVENICLKFIFGRENFIKFRYCVLEVILQVLKFVFFLQMVGKYFKC